jgi:hypothetical protein
MSELPFDDDSLERAMFRARAERMPPPELPSVDAVIVRGEVRRRARAVALVPATVSRVFRALAKTAAPIAMLHAAAGILVFVAWSTGIRVERARPDVTSLDSGHEHARDHGPMMSLEEGDPARGTCEAAASLFGLTCESLPASMPITMRERASCDAPGALVHDGASTNGMPRTSTAAICEGSFATCDDSVTCADDRP